jgi:hypothetical protein
MIPTLQRTYSKAKAIANNVVWTDQETIPVNFNIDGLISTGVYGLFTVSGRPLYCAGFQVDFTVPSQDPGTVIYVNLIDENSETVPGSLLKLYGCTAGNRQTIAPAFLIPSGNSVQFNVAVVNGIDEYLPQDAALTYYFRYANGLPGQQIFTSDLLVAPGAQQPATVPQVFFEGHYGGVAPTFTPSVPVAKAYDLDTTPYHEWTFVNGTWNG